MGVNEGWRSRKERGWRIKIAEATAIATGGGETNMTDHRAESRAAARAIWPAHGIPILRYYPKAALAIPAIRIGEINESSIERLYGF